MKDNTNIINKIWQSSNKQLPCIDCIIFPDDRVIMLDFTIYQDSETQNYTAEVKPMIDGTLASYVKYQNDWVCVDAWRDAHCTDGEFRYIGGDGAYGSDGFVACEDGQGNLVWAMFFTNTNPIAKLNINDNHLIATTEHGKTHLKINLNDITKITYFIDN